MSDGDGVRREEDRMLQTHTETQKHETQKPNYKLVIGLKLVCTVLSKNVVLCDQDRDNL